MQLAKSKERGAVTRSITALRSEQPEEVIRPHSHDALGDAEVGLPPFMNTPTHTALTRCFISNLESRSGPKAVVIPGVVGKSLCMRQEIGIAQTPISGKGR